MRGSKIVSKRKWTPEEREKYQRILEGRMDELGMIDNTPDYVVLEDRKKKNKRAKAKRKTKDCGCK